MPSQSHCAAPGCYRANRVPSRRRRRSVRSSSAEFAERGKHRREVLRQEPVSQQRVACLSMQGLAETGIRRYGKWQVPATHLHVYRRSQSMSARGEAGGQRRLLELSSIAVDTALDAQAQIFKQAGLARNASHLAPTPPNEGALKQRIVRLVQGARRCGHGQTNRKAEHRAQAAHPADNIWCRTAWCGRGLRCLHRRIDVRDLRRARQAHGHAATQQR